MRWWRIDASPADLLQEDSKRMVDLYRMEGTPDQGARVSADPLGASKWMGMKVYQFVSDVERDEEGEGSSEDSSEEEEEVFAAAAETRAWLKAQEEDHRGRSLGEWGDGTASQSISSPSAGGGGGGGGVSVEEQHRASDAWLMEAALETAVLQGETCMFPPCFALLGKISATISATTATVAAGNSEGRDTAQHADAGKQEAEEIPPWGPMLPFCTSVGDRDPLALPLMRQRDAYTAHSARLRLQDQCSQPKDIPVISLHDAVESIQSNPQAVYRCHPTEWVEVLVDALMVGCNLSASKEQLLGRRRRTRTSSASGRSDDSHASSSEGGSAGKPEELLKLRWDTAVRRLARWKLPNINTGIDANLDGVGPLRVLSIDSDTGSAGAGPGSLEGGGERAAGGGGMGRETLMESLRSLSQGEPLARLQELETPDAGTTFKPGTDAVAVIRHILRLGLRGQKRKQQGEGSNLLTAELVRYCTPGIKVLEETLQSRDNLAVTAMETVSLGLLDEWQCEYLKQQAIFGGLQADSSEDADTKARVPSSDLKDVGSLLKVKMHLSACGSPLYP